MKTYDSYEEQQAALQVEEIRKIKPHNVFYANPPGAFNRHQRRSQVESFKRTIRKVQRLDRLKKARANKRGSQEETSTEEG